MNLVLYFVIGYFALYTVVWLHEVGHALWYRKYHLKNDWWNVKVKPYIFFSTPGGVDIEVWNQLKPIQHVLASYGGLMANLVFALLSGGLILATPNSSEFLRVALWLFMTLHIGEIVSYLFVGSIFLSSDMEMIHRDMPGLRIPNLILGAVLVLIYVYLLTLVPGEFRLFVVIWNIVTVLSMCAGRIIFTSVAKRNRSN